MPSDASIYGLIRPQPEVPFIPPEERQLRQMRLRQLMGAEEAQRMQLEDARTERETRGRLQDLYRTNPNASPEQVAPIDYRAAEALRKARIEEDAKRAGTAKTQAETSAALAKQGRDLIAGATPETLPAVLEWGVKNNQLWALRAPTQIMSDPQAFAQWQRQNVLGADEWLKRNAPTISEQQTAATAPFTPGPNGPVPNKPVQDFMLNKARASAPSVSVKVDQKTGESLAKPIGEMVQGSKEIALGALDQIDVAKRVGAALDSGKVIVGPGADARLAVAQLGQVLGVGGKSNEEALVNTRNLIKGLAEFTLSARKQLKGQGQVSDYEGKLIQRAASGEVSDMTVPEIRALVSVSERLARKGYDLHKKNLETLRSGEHKALAPYYDVPELPPESKPASGGLDPSKLSDSELKRELGIK